MISTNDPILNKWYMEGKLFIYSFRTLYQLQYSLNSGFSLLKLRRKTNGIPYTFKNMMVAYSTQYLG